MKKYYKLKRLTYAEEIQIAASLYRQLNTKSGKNLSRQRIIKKIAETLDRPTSIIKIYLSHIEYVYVSKIDLFVQEKIDWRYFELMQRGKRLAIRDLRQAEYSDKKIRAIVNRLVMAMLDEYLNTGTIEYQKDPV